MIKNFIFISYNSIEFCVKLQLTYVPRFDRARSLAKSTISNHLRRQSIVNQAFARGARRALRNVRRLVEDKNKNLEIQTAFDENTASTLHPDQDKIIAACLVLKSKGLAVSLLTLEPERRIKAHAASIDIFNYQEFEPLPFEMPIPYPNDDDIHLMESKSFISFG